MLLPSVFSRNLQGDLFNDFFDDFDIIPRSVFSFGNRNDLMKTDIKENESGFELELDLPGYKKEDVKAQLKDGYLTVSAETKKEDESKDVNFIRKERYCGSCSRSFYVGENVTEDDIKARFENGILTLNIPKKEALPEAEQPGYIAIEG